MTCDECKYKGTWECYARILAKALNKPITAEGCSRGVQKDKEQK